MAEGDNPMPPMTVILQWRHLAILQLAHPSPTRCPLGYPYGLGTIKFRMTQWDGPAYSQTTL